MVYTDFIKKMSSRGDVLDHYYLQTKSKVGVDLVIEREGKLDLIEIKSSKTLTPALSEQLVATAAAFGKCVARCILLGPYADEMVFQVDAVDIQARPWFRS